MPPSHHSSSSHSSFSSSSRSFSSSSRSSYSSSRSYSSPSRSSYSSPSRSSYSRPSPSPRSSSSHSSYSGSGITRGSSPSTRSGPSSVPRTRSNQPVFKRGTVQPQTFRCARHDYWYFPTPWVYEGRTYNAGYYDENGQYYENVAIKDEKGDSTIMLTCEYCGSQAKYKWTEGELPNCSHCGAPMTISKVETDSVVSESTAPYDNSYNNASGINPGFTETKKPKKKRIWLWVLIALVLIGTCSNSVDSGSSGGSSGGTAAVTSTLYLNYSGNGIYDISSSSNCDKTLVWSDQDECWYDEQSDVWLYCNQDVSPEVWQYWYEGASSQFGDYGWMECEGSDWYVEVSNGNWQLYTGDTSSFWHIRNSFD